MNQFDKQAAKLIKEYTELPEDMHSDVHYIDYQTVCRKYGDEVGLEVLNYIEEEWGENGADVFKDSGFDIEVVMEFIKDFSSISNKSE